MGMIIRNGIVYAGGENASAETTSYDNTESGLSADNVQGAIDELLRRIEALEDTEQGG